MRDKGLEELVGKEEPTHFVHAGIRCGVAITILSAVLNLLVLDTFRYDPLQSVIEGLVMFGILWTVISVLVFWIYSLGKPKNFDYNKVKKPYLIVLGLVLIWDLWASASLTALPG